MLSSLDKLSSNLNKEQFRETRKYLELFYIEQPNHPQTNNVTEGGEEGEAIHIHEDYWNYPYQPPALTPDEQQQIEEDLTLMTQKEFTYMNIWIPLNDSNNHSYHPKTSFIAH